MIAFMLSNNDFRRSWLLSLDNRKPGDDIEAKSCSSFADAEGLRSSRYAAILLMTAINAGYIAVSFPWLVVIML